MFVEHALWFGLLDHSGKMVRVPATVCGAYDCLTPVIHNHLPEITKEDNPHLLSSQVCEFKSRIYKHDFRHFNANGSALGDGQHWSRNLQRVNENLHLAESEHLLTPFRQPNSALCCVLYEANYV